VNPGSLWADPGALWASPGPLWAVLKDDWPPGAKLSGVKSEGWG